MKRNTLIITLMTLFAVVSMGAFGGCDEDGDTTIWDLCYKLSDGYCTRAADLGCNDYSACYKGNTGVCDTMFDNTCKATSADKEKIDHDIDNIINTKTTCDGLSSIDSYLGGTLSDMATACQSNNNDTTGMDIGLMCENVIAAICAKVQTLGCDPSMTLTQCESGLMSSGEIAIGNHTCLSAGDHTPGTSSQKASYDAMMAEIGNVTSCSEFGF